MTTLLGPDVIGRRDPTGTAYRPWPVIYDPPEACGFYLCDHRIDIAPDRTVRSKAGVPYCTALHKIAATIWHPNGSVHARAQVEAARAARRAAKRAELCPRPDKRGYGSRDEAVNANRALLASDGLLQPYGCRCGRWHVGHKRRDPALVVGKRIRGATPAELAALRATLEHPADQRRVVVPAALALEVRDLPRYVGYCPRCGARTGTYPPGTTLGAVWWAANHDLTCRKAVYA